MTQLSKTVKSAITMTKKQSKFKLDTNGGYRPPTNTGDNQAILCDTSGSMIGAKIIALRDTVRQIGSKLHKARFVSFSSSVHEFQPDNYESLQPTGMTHMYEALELAYSFKAHSIVLITDGSPNDRTKSEILDLAQMMEIPVNPIGISDGGTGIDEYFLRQLAERTGGTYQNVEESQLQDLLPSVEKVLQITADAGTINL